MKLETAYIQKVKTVAHIFQGLFIFISGCITLAILTKSGGIGGATKWYFALCFLTIPALVYLVMVPMWSRSERFANVYAFIALDALFTVCWLSAFWSVAFMNSDAIKAGAKDKKDGDKAVEPSCKTFQYGSEAKCDLSKATVGLGAVIFVLFLITTAVSGYYVRQFRTTGATPFNSGAPVPVNPEGGKGDGEDVWSHDMHRHDDDDHDHDSPYGDNNRAAGPPSRGRQDDEYALLHNAEQDEAPHPGRPISWGQESYDRREGVHDRDDDYYGGSAPPPANVVSPSALSPGGYSEDPSYRGRSNYNFSGGPEQR